jgi:hypothetical protein
VEHMLGLVELGLVGLVG